MREYRSLKSIFLVRILSVANSSPASSSCLRRRAGEVKPTGKDENVFTDSRNREGFEMLSGSAPQHWRTLFHLLVERWADKKSNLHVFKSNLPFPLKMVVSIILLDHNKGCSAGAGRSSSPSFYGR